MGPFDRELTERERECTVLILSYSCEHARTHIARDAPRIYAHVHARIGESSVRKTSTTRAASRARESISCSFRMRAARVVADRNRLRLLSSAFSSREVLLRE